MSDHQKNYYASDRPWLEIAGAFLKVGVMGYGGMGAAGAAIFARMILA